MGRFEGKVALITGGGSGLGRLCALQWAAEGASVVVTDLIEQRANVVAAQINDEGGKALSLKADVTREAEIEAAVAAAVAKYGRLDIMFANAGKAVPGFGTIALEDISEAEWDDVNDVVYKGVFYAGKHACRQMKTQAEGGNIVVTVSAGGHNAYPGFGPYCAGKAGAAGLVRSMAYDWGRYGIRVNGLSPVHGMSVNFALPPETPALGMSYEEAQLAESGAGWDAATMFPGPLKVKRPPSLEDNAAVATFLASDASTYMSGVVIPSCDGGSFARTSIPIPENWSLEDQA
ncbi:MAG: SDR family NAD(P)-dependent oxidoreductase [Actinomycetota bacterium]|nr:SDR family NAD(P)-dependent oxidoreductase [Actinomycetota bacterium]